MALQVKSFIISSINTTDAEITAGIGVTSTDFSASVIPINDKQARVIVIYN